MVVVVGQPWWWFLPDVSYVPAGARLRLLPPHASERRRRLDSWNGVVWGRKVFEVHDVVDSPLKRILLPFDAHRLVMVEAWWWHGARPDGVGPHCTMVALSVVVVVVCVHEWDRPWFVIRAAWRDSANNTTSLGRWWGMMQQPQYFHDTNIHTRRCSWCHY